MIKRFALICSLLFFCFESLAQSYSVTGRVADKKDTSSLIGVTVICTSVSDTSIKTGTTTDLNGMFVISGLEPGRYMIHLDYVGYKSSDNRIKIVDKDINVGAIAMSSSSNELKAFTAYGKQVRAEQNGDTTSFHADAYKVNPDATTEDLITKMPGVTSDNTGVKVHGEAVQQVYVDGKPFFGTDPTLSVRNLPAEVVDQVQIYDQLSDQALFTGFDDGNSQKTMNIVTRKDKRQGQFGKLFAGYGDNGTFNAGGAFNSFDGDRRISIIESSNNINSQNFSSQDILGLGSGGGRGGGGGAFGGGGGAGSNFLTNAQQPGITTVHSAGINFSDQWMPDSARPERTVKLTASYFFNYTNNTTTTQTNQDFSFPNASSLVENSSTYGYNEHDYTHSQNYNSRFNLRFEYNIDSSNSLVYTPNFNLQNNYATSSTIDSNFNFNQNLIRNSSDLTTSNNTGYTFSNNLVLRHKLKKKGRTISLNINNSFNEKAGDGTVNTIAAQVDSAATSLNQIYKSYTTGNTVGGNLSYTEPLGKISQLMFNYNPSVTYSKANTETDTTNLITGQTLFDTTLSNKYQSTYTTQRGGISYRIATKALNFMIGVNLQYATLDGAQTFPSSFNYNKTFQDVLPIALFNYKFKNGKNLRLMYRTNITPPGISQLQNVVNVTNPSMLSVGNQYLKQDYEQTLILRYGLTRGKTAHNFFIYGYGNYVNNYIGSATYSYSGTKDSTIADGILMKSGAQLSVPVNLNYYANTKLNLTYGLPLDIIKSNLNLTGGIAYTHTPGEINNVLDYSNNTIPNAGIVISSNVSKELDFTLAYSANYNVIKNSLQGQGNNDYYSHTASFKINWIFLKGVVVNSNISNAYYATLSSSSGVINYYLWTSYVGYKFLKNRALEARFTVFDMLNQNKSVTRTVGANYVENTVTNVLQRYGMLQLTYTLRNYKGALPENSQEHEWHNHDFGGPPPGGPPPGGGGPPPGGGPDR